MDLMKWHPLNLLFPIFLLTSRPILSAGAEKVDTRLVDIKNQQRLHVGFDSVKQKARLTRDRGFFLVEPSDVTVNQGSTISIPCGLNETALSEYVGFPIDVTLFEAAWIKNGEPVLIIGSEGAVPKSDERYKLVGDRLKGEYHIRITDVDMKKDSGLWSCMFNKGLISSALATLNVIEHVGPDLKMKSPSHNTEKRSTNHPKLDPSLPLINGGNGKRGGLKGARFVQVPLPLSGNPMPTGIKPYHACLDDKFLVTVDFTLSPEDLPNGKERVIWLIVPKTAYSSPNYTVNNLLNLPKEEFLKSLNDIFHIDPAISNDKSNNGSKRRIKRVRRAMIPQTGGTAYEKCKLEYTYNPNSGNNSISVYVPYNGCGTILSHYNGDKRISNLTNSMVIVLNKNKDGSGDMEYKHHVIEKNNSATSPLGNRWTKFSYFAYDPPQRILGTFVFSCFLPTPMTDIEVKMSKPNAKKTGGNSEFKSLEISKEPVPQKRQLPSDCPAELKDMDFQMEFDCQDDGFDINFKFPKPFTGEIKVMGVDSNFHEKCNYKLNQQTNYKLVIPFDRCSTHSSTQYEPYHNGISLMESGAKAEPTVSRVGHLGSNPNARNRPLFTKYSEYNTTLYFEQHCSRSFNIRKINCQRWDPLYHIPENF